MDYRLPVSVATKTQVVNVLRNLEDVLDKGIQNTIRSEEGVDFQDIPDVSSALAQIVKVNNLKVNTKNLRALGKWLEGLKHNAPVVRFTFASDPNNEVVSKLVKWLRDNSNKTVLIRTSVQPSVAAGCIMHTSSHRYDFSLRNELLQGIPIFTKYLNKMVVDASATSQSQPAAEVSA